MEGRPSTAPSMRPHFPAPSPLARAVCQGLTGASPAGFTLLEVALVCGGLALLSTGAFVVYQSAANSADVRTEQEHVQQIGQRADRIQGVIGSYQGMTTADAVANKIPPASMVVGSGLMSRWSQPVLLEPTDIGTRTNAGLKITYEAVPPRACLKFVQAAGQGMYEVEVGGQSVFSHRPPPSNAPLRLEPALALPRCAQTPTPVAFTYFGGATGLIAMVNEPVSLPPRLAPPTLPPTAPPPAPPPVAPPPPPSAPGCGAAPGTPAIGATPPGQACSFIWTPAPNPACWAPQALCAPIVAPLPTTPPPSSPPSTPPPSVPPPPPGVPCVVPAPSTENDAQTGTCLPGTLTPPGAQTFPQTRHRTITYSCPDPFDAPLGTPGPWSPWLPTVGASCAPICVAPSPLAETRAGTPNTRPIACGANYYGSQTQTQTTTQHRTTTYSCPAPTGAYTPHVGAWSAPGAPLGAWTTTSSACTACPAPTSQSANEWAPRSAPCPAGWTGSHTWEEVRTHARPVSYSCPAGTATLPPATYGAYGAWSWTGTTRNVVNTCAPPPAVAACDATDRTEIPGSGLGGPPNRACTTSTIGMRAFSTYISCGSNNMCGGTGNLAECQPAGWKIICGAGSAPYTPCATPAGPGWQELGSQGTQDYLDRTYGSGPSRYFTTYSCPGTGGMRGDWRPVHYATYGAHQTQAFFIRAEPGPAVPAACLVPPIDTSTNPLAKIVWRIQVTPDCPCTSANFGARMTRGAAVDQNGSSSDGKEFYYESTFTCTTAWSSY